MPTSCWVRNCFKSSDSADFKDSFIFFSKRSLSSPAAFTVNVEINKESIGTPLKSLSKIRSTITKVFPEPAEADTRTLLPKV